MKKLFVSTILALALLTMSVGAVFAQETTTITGTVETVSFGTDANGTTTVIVGLRDDQGVLQTVTLSLETATSLGLVTTDSNGVTTVIDTAIGTLVTIDTADVSTEPTEDQHPVGSALSDFFSGLLGVDYDTVMSYHDDGVGFGVIAQALWLTNSLDGDSSVFTALLDAKQSGDYSAITLADGSTPDNWGDVVKSIKHGDNLGSVMSRKDDANRQGGGNGKPENPGGDNGKPENPGGGNGKPENPGNGNGNGNGKPENPGNGNGNGKP